MREILGRFEKNSWVRGNVNVQLNRSIKIMQFRKCEIINYFLQRKICTRCHSICYLIEVPQHILHYAFKSYFSILEENMIASKLVTYYSILNIMQYTVGSLPTSVKVIVEALVACRRIKVSHFAPESSHTLYSHIIRRVVILCV